MKNTLRGRVVKGVASRFSVFTEDGVKTCLARGRLKSDGLIYVGDYVEFEEITSETDTKR